MDPTNIFFLGNISLNWCPEKRLQMQDSCQPLLLVTLAAFILKRATIKIFQVKFCVILFSVIRNYISKNWANQMFKKSVQSPE